MFHLQQDDFPVDTHVSRCIPVDTLSYMFTHFHTIITFRQVQTYSHQIKYMLQVFEIAKAIGWVPDVADRNKTYLHLNQRIPNELKFDLNCLLFTHGKLCRKCTKKASNKQRKESHDDSCPLLNYCNHNRQENE